jgi:hypothetical protein
MSERKRNTLAIVSLLVFVAAATLGVHSFFISENLQWCPGAVHVDEDPIQTRIMRYEVALSHGALAFLVSREDWNSDAGTNRGWFWMRSHSPDSLITDPLPGDRVNFALVGFQYYHGVFPIGESAENQQAVHNLVLPLWPLLFGGIVPLLWWRRRRRIKGPGFPVTV